MSNISYDLDEILEEFKADRKENRPVFVSKKEQGNDPSGAARHLPLQGRQSGENPPAPPRDTPDDRGEDDPYAALRPTAPREEAASRRDDPSGAARHLPLQGRQSGDDGAEAVPPRRGGSHSRTDAPRYGSARESARTTPRQSARREKKTPSGFKLPSLPSLAPRGGDEGPDSARRIGLGVLSGVLAVCAMLCLLWSVKYIHPNGSAAPAVKNSRSDIAAALDAGTGVEDQTEEAAPAEPEEPHQIEGQDPVEPTPVPTPEPIHYSIPAGQLPAAPKPECYGSVPIGEAASVMDVIEQARACGLLGEDEALAFNPEANFYWDSEIVYYFDETILTICWKEVIEGNTCSFSEVKVADASQFRRKLAGDAFGSPNQYYASELAVSSNAVVAMNADYYLFRDFGIVVYEGGLYRFNTSTYTGMYKKYNCVDNLFITDEGDFLFYPIATETTQADLEDYIARNKVRFSLAFGPVLVNEGEVQVCSWYPVGEIDRGYSRAGIGQMDKLHYLYMGLNHSPEAEARWSVNKFAQHFGEKGVRNAYCLDGGQTGEIVWRGKPYNHVDYGAERLVSDIIYFASALPQEVSP